MSRQDAIFALLVMLMGFMLMLLGEVANSYMPFYWGVVVAFISIWLLGVDREW